MVARFNSAAVNPSTVQAGGTVVFPLTTGFEDCCFSEELGLPWKVQDYYRADFFPGSAAEELGILQDSIYNVKANLIKHVHPADVVFGPGEETWTQSMVWAPEHMGHQPGVAAAAFAATQGGHVGYVGDVNWEEASGEIVLAMLQHSTA